VSGVVEPLRTFGVNSQTSGALLRSTVEEGIARPRGPGAGAGGRPRDWAQVRSARRSTEVTRAAYQRAEQLRERQVITRRRVRARPRGASRRRARSSTSSAPACGFTRRSAPRSAGWSREAVETGDVVGAQTRLFEIGDVSTLVVRVLVSELDVVRSRAGDARRWCSTPSRRSRSPGASAASSPRPTRPRGWCRWRSRWTGESARVARPGFLARVTFALGTRDGVPWCRSRRWSGDGRRARPSSWSRTARPPSADPVVTGPHLAGPGGDRLWRGGREIRWSSWATTRARRRHGARRRGPGAEAPRSADAAGGAGRPAPGRWPMSARAAAAAAGCRAGRSAVRSAR
jgi:hypothetical protein